MFEHLRDLNPNAYNEQKDKFTSYQQCLAKWNSQLRKRTSASMQPEADDRYELNVHVNWKNMNLNKKAEEDEKRQRNVASITDALIQDMLHGDVEDDMMSELLARSRSVMHGQPENQSIDTDPILAKIIAQKRLADDKPKSGDQRDNFRNYRNSYNLRWNLLYPTALNRNSDDDILMTSQL